MILILAILNTAVMDNSLSVSVKHARVHAAVALGGGRVSDDHGDFALNFSWYTLCILDRVRLMLVYFAAAAAKLIGVLLSSFVSHPSHDASCGLPHLSRPSFTTACVSSPAALLFFASALIPSL